LPAGFFHLWRLFQDSISQTTYREEDIIGTDITDYMKTGFSKATLRLAE
jgi:hypothetical protein